MSDDKKVTDLKEHAHKVLKKNIPTAETIVGDVQSQWEAENAQRLQERVERSQKRLKEYEERIDDLQKELRITQQNYISEVRKCQDLRKSECFKPDVSQFNEEEAIVFDEDCDMINRQAEALDKLEKGE